MKTMTAFWTAALMSSALVACMPPQSGPQGPESEAGAQAGAKAPAVAAAPPPKESAAPPVPTEQECRTRAAKASPAGTTGSDTKQQLDQLFDAHHETFRCCFDAIDASKKPLTGAKVTLLFKIDSAGKLKSSEIVAAESDAVSAEGNKCMTYIAGTLAYPKPTTNASFGYKRTFDFKSRR